jgi:hypothetical protein
MNKFTQEDLDKVLGDLHQGPVGERSQKHWDNIEKFSIGRAIFHSKPISEAIKKKMSKAAKGRVNKSSKDPIARAKAAKTISKGVRVFTYPDMKLIGEYSNTKEAGISTDTHPSIVQSVARGLHTSCKGYTYEYISKKSYAKVNNLVKYIQAFTYPDMKLVGEYSSLKQAGEELGVKPSYVQAVLSPKRPGVISTGGYTFKKVT